MRHISPPELAAWLRSEQEPPLLLDVREPWEFAICRIEGSQLIPMRQLIPRLGDLDRHRPTVVICHHGIRSQQVAQYLDHQGFTGIINLRGGVAAWARDVDPSMATY